jgi:two-component system, chemotaxis family, protein-glutamate methylesterase/glutaminase
MDAENRMRVLIAEDERTSATTINLGLRKVGYETVVVSDGDQAIHALSTGVFDIVITDWMMPGRDGIDVIRWIRGNLTPPPIVLMLTSLDDPESRGKALLAGADAFLAKPASVRSILDSIRVLLDRAQQAIPLPSRVLPTRAPAGRVPYVAVALTASTGGPEAILTWLKAFPYIAKASMFLVQHGPRWMLESLSARIQAETQYQVVLGQSEMPTRAGHLYVAPGEHHMTIDPVTLAIDLNSNPPENFVRPAADPLFHSIAQAFRTNAVGVVLTGLGRDGARGADFMAKHGASVFIQSPETAVAPSMPQSTLALGIVRKALPLVELGPAVGAVVRGLVSGLRTTSGETRT